MKTLRRGMKRVRNLPAAWAAAMAAAALFALAASLPDASAMVQPGAKNRTVSTASYQLVVQNNGKVDVLLNSGLAVFDNAFPVVWLEGEEEPEPMRVSGRTSVRTPVRDALGAGQGITMRSAEAEWALRAYPVEKYFVVQAAFINREKEAVRVRAISPWTAGAGTSGGLTAPGEVLERPEEGPRPFLYEYGASTLVIGFLPPAEASGIVAGAGGGERRSLSAWWQYEEPVEVAPGEKLVAPPVFVGLIYDDAEAAMEAYQQAMERAL
jgi:hypothetical protein